MGILIRTLRLLLQLLAVAFIARWLLIRLRRILVLPTNDTTPPIGADQVRPRMRRLILSDLHLGGGDRLDDFDVDDELVAFIRLYAMSGEPTELILAGDTFEFLQVRLPGLNDYEWSGDAAVRRLQTILAAHPKPIVALRDFIARPNNILTLLIGNHDFELHYAQAKQLLRQALGVEESDERLRFGIRYEGGGIYLDHGSQFDPWNRFVHFEGISDPFEVVRGTRVVKDVINPLEDDPLEVAPLVDNVKPISAFFWYMLALPRLRVPQVRHFVIRGLLLLFRTVALPRVYHRRPVLQVREELLGPPGQTLQRELALQAVYENDSELRQAAAVEYGGVEPEVRLRQRLSEPVSRLPGLARRLVRDNTPSETMLAEIEQAANQQLRREIREFKDVILREIASIAADPEHAHNSLFVCGHTHLAQIVALNDSQTYVNIGTWTAVVLDIARDRRQDQRFPFLEVVYPDDSGTPRGSLLVWRGVDLESVAWITAPEPIDEDEFD